MDKDTIGSLRQLGKMTLEDQPDRETFKSRILNLFQFVSKRSYGGLFRDDGRLYELARAHIIANVNAIYKQSESPIETLFLCSLLLSGLDVSPFFITITSPIIADELPDLFYEKHEQRKRAVLDARRRGQVEPDLELLVETVRSIQDIQKIARTFMSDHMDGVAKVLGDDSIGAKMQEYLVGEVSRGFHVSLQSTFKSIQVEDRSIRPDIFIWSPAQRFKIIVECDGYTYHHDQKSFSRDRVRDRVLQQHGYQTFRFSGQEIFHDSVLKAFEFIEYLFRILTASQKPTQNAHPASNQTSQKHKTSKKMNRKHRRR